MFFYDVFMGSTRILEVLSTMQLGVRTGKTAEL